MAVAVAKRDARLDLRLSADEKSRIEQAAYSRGISVSSWAIANLIERAEQDIADAQTIELSNKAFDAFAQALEAPCDKAFAKFAAESTIWQN